MRQHKGIALGLVLAWVILGPSVGSAALQYGLGDPALGQTLVQAGWKVSRSSDGGMLLYPPQVKSEVGGEVVTATEVAKVSEAKEVGDSPVSTGDAAAGTAPDWDRLRGLGWRVEQERDGSVLLYPPIPQAETVAKVNANVSEPELTRDAKVSEPEPMLEANASQPEQTLDALLRARGWRVERDVGGSLLLYPRDRPLEVTPSPGVETAPVRDGDIALPVDSWTEANTIASAWLTAHGASDWRVGKIRQIHQVYLISIVDSARPARLVHQIAVRAGNGTVVVLN